MTSAAKSLVNCGSGVYSSGTLIQPREGQDGAGWHAPLPPAVVVPGTTHWCAFRLTQLGKKVS